MANNDYWEPKRRFEIQYERNIRELVQRLMDQAESATDPLAWADMLNALAQEDWFHHAALEAASRMVTGLAITGAKSWREAARASMRGAEIYRALQEEMQGPVGARIFELVQHSAALIKSVPQTVAERVTRFVSEQQQKGLRASTIAKQLRVELPELSTGRIRLIARTETSKASTALTQARSEDLDLDWYVWRSSEDQRVRPSHRMMDARGGCLVRWNDPASPERLLGIKSTLGHYHAGDCPNCRCYPEPLLRMDQVMWPHPVYYGNAIRMMSRAAFLKIAGAEVRVAA